MDSILRFSYEELGIDKATTAIILAFLFIVRLLIIKARQKRSDQGRHISEMIEEIEKNSSPRYYFTVEQVFLNRYGRLINYPAIKFFLKSQTASLDIFEYLAASAYIKFNEDYTQVVYRKFYGEKRIIGYLVGHFISYFIFGCVALMMALALPMSGVSLGNAQELATYMILIVSSIFFAGNSLHSSVGMLSAKSFMKRKRSAINDRTV